MGDVYSQIMTNHIMAFQKKHGIEFDYVVDDTIGREVILFGDYFFNLKDICYDVVMEIDNDKIFEWYNKCLDADGLFPSYEEWIKQNVLTELK